MARMEQPPRMETSQEVRFAVVMYGGVSLAVYMNGVAQELRKMVRATAPNADDGQRAALSDEALGPRSTEAVYRKLGRMLSWGAPARAKVETDEPIRTRFVVDILSGSSAGGINAVYLAKALANDQPMDELKRLWIEEGDIGVLVNDKASTAGTQLDRQVPPRSLLNGTRMYWKMLDALDGMDKAPRPDGQAPARNAEELDLYVTATDMAGRAVKLQLADKPVEEYRHRNVFHFRYDGDAHNDFLADDNPFLAFAARCTSAHPAAFEPMRFGDVDEVLERHPSYAEDPQARAASPRWRRFFKEYLRRADGDPREFLYRDFNDGGVLDNRPFRHATDAMPLHRAVVPVSRKLVYLDPAPEHLEIGPRNKRRPTVPENAWASLSTLPRYEPIQEDLQRVLERNRLIERVNTIVEGMAERDFEYGPAREERERSAWRLAHYTDERWDRTTLSEMVRERGLAWAGYHHLRVTEVTDELALLLTRAAGFDADSDESRAIRHLVRSRREMRYDPDGEGGKLTEYAFLVRYDVGWRLRRLRYALARIDRMLGAPERARELVEQAGQPDPGVPGSPVFEEFREELLRMRRELDGARTRLRRHRDRLWEAGDQRLREVAGAVLGEGNLEEFLVPQSPGALDERARAKVEAGEAGFDRFGEVVRECVGPPLRAAEETCDRAMPPPPPGGYAEKAASGAQIAQRAARFYYDDFANYDMISYPILYSTGVGEEMARVDVFRISPIDADSLVDEEKDKRPKLAGMKLSSFGAFFDERFRTNDILWGRLDGAERIITALLPRDEDRDKRVALISEAHCAILTEEVFGKKSGAPSSLPPAAPASEAEVLERFKSKYDEDYEAARRFDARSTARSAARASRVFGDLLDGYAETQRRLPKGGVVWITRLARLFWVLVEVAVPDTLPSLLFRHGLQIVYVFEALMILLGTLLLNPTVQQFGFVAFAATAAIHAAVLLLEDATTPKVPETPESARGRPEDEKRSRPLARYGRPVLIALAALGVILAVLGVVLVLAALGLQFPQRLVALVTEPPGEPASGTTVFVRGALMLVPVVILALATARSLRRRLKL